MGVLFCGIDLGTQGARCVIVRDDGEVCGDGKCKLTGTGSTAREGWHEQEPAHWLEAVAAAVRQAVENLEPHPPQSDRVEAIGVTSTSGTLLALDSHHEPVGPAVMYNDSRARAQAERVQDVGRALSEKLGYGFSASFGLPKILWLKEQKPDAYQRTDLFCSPTDYLIGCLTDRWGISDQTNMLKFGYDLLEDRWPDFIDRDIGIDVQRLAMVQKPGKVVGRLTPDWAERCRLEAGIPVVSGLTDGCASQISSGAVAPGDYNTTLGTTLVIKGVSSTLLLDPEGRIYCHRHPEGWWLPGGASNTGAECLAREFGQEQTERLSACALGHSPSGVVAYPLVGRGERFPFRAPHAESFMLGEPKSRQELFCAYLEGVACLERLAYETVEGLGAQVGHLVYSAGGGSKSDAWLQIRADTLGRTVIRPHVTGAAMGAAILAASHRHYGNLSDAAQAMARIERAAEPRPGYAPRYDEQYQVFRDECARRGWL